MGFKHIQGNGAHGSTAAITVTLSLPTTGNLICAAFRMVTPNTFVSLQDGNGVNFTLSPLSPRTDNSHGVVLGLAYLLVPASPSTTVVLTSSSSSTDLWADEFSFSGAATFDADIFGNTSVAGTTINTPIITPRFGDELVYAVTLAGGVVTAPTAGAVLGSWTGAAGGIQNGNDAEYILSQAANAIAVNYTCTSGQWAGMAMSFYQVVVQPISGGTQGILGRMESRPRSEFIA